MFIDRYDYLHNPDQQNFGVEFRKIVFPNNQDFALPEFSYFGYPQLSLACRDVRFFLLHSILSLKSEYLLV
jgi:hypothetical protein